MTYKKCIKNYCKKSYGLRYVVYKEGNSWEKYEFFHESCFILFYIIILKELLISDISCSFRYTYIAVLI